MKLIQYISVVVLTFLSFSQALMVPQICKTKQFGYKLQDPEDCHAFYVCLGNLGQFSLDCGQGYRFNETLQKCVRGKCPPCPCAVGLYDSGVQITGFIPMKLYQMIPIVDTNNFDSYNLTQQNLIKQIDKQIIEENLNEKPLISRKTELDSNVKEVLETSALSEVSPKYLTSNDVTIEVSTQSAPTELPTSRTDLPTTFTITELPTTITDLATTFTTDKNTELTTDATALPTTTTDLPTTLTSEQNTNLPNESTTVLPTTTTDIATSFTTDINTDFPTESTTFLPTTTDLFSTFTTDPNTDLPTDRTTALPTITTDLPTNPTTQPSTELTTDFTTITELTTDTTTVLSTTTMDLPTNPTTKPSTELPIESTTFAPTTTTDLPITFTTDPSTDLPTGGTTILSTITTDLPTIPTTQQSTELTTDSTPVLSTTESSTDVPTTKTESSTNTTSESSTDITTTPSNTEPSTPSTVTIGTTTKSPTITTNTETITETITISSTEISTETTTQSTTECTTQSTTKSTTQTTTKCTTQTTTTCSTQSTTKYTTKCYTTTPKSPSNCQDNLPENKEIIDLICANRNDGDFIKDPKACNKYYTCYQKHAYHQTCPGQFYFDDKLKMCNYPELVECHHSSQTKPLKITIHEYIPQRNSHKTDDLTRVKPIQQVQSKKPLVSNNLRDYQNHLKSDDCKTLKSGTSIRDLGDCRKYYVCLNGNAIALYCPRGQYFDIERHVCNYKFLVKNCAIFM